jgi:hypothetical protein
MWERREFHSDLQPEELNVRRLMDLGIDERTTLNLVFTCWDS